jgi:hypothetical protein
MSQALQLSFQTNTDQARNAIAQLASTVASNMVQIGTVMKAANDNVGALTTGLKLIPAALGAAGIAFLAFKAGGEAIAEARAEMEKLVQLGKDAATAGVSATWYDAIIKRTKELRGDTDELIKALHTAYETSKPTIDSGGTGQPSTARAALSDYFEKGFTGNFQSAGLGIFDRAKDAEERVRGLAVAIKELQDLGIRLGAVDLAERVFGRDFGEKVRQNEKYIEDFVKRLDDVRNHRGEAGVDEQSVKNAKELTERLDAANEALGKMLTITFGLAGAGGKLLSVWASILETIVKAGAASARLPTPGSLRGASYEDLQAQQAELQKAVDEDSRIRGSRDIYAPARRARLAEINARLQAQQDAQYSPEAIAQLEEYQSQRAGTFRGAPYDPQYAETGGVPTPTRRPLSLFTNPPGEERAKQPAAESADQVDAYIKSLQKSVEVLEAENRTFGESNTVKAEAVDLERALAAARQRGTPLTDAERESVKKLADEEGAAKDRAEQLQKAQAAANEQAQFLGNQLISAFDSIGESGKKATDVIKDMVKALIKAVEQALILGSGPLANLFGTQGQGGNTGGLAGFAVGGLRGAFGGGGGGATDFGGGAADAAGDIVTDVFAEGGMAGQGRFRKYVPRSAFIGAPAFASGGGIPAILHPGEVVLNAAQQKSVASRMGGPRINVTHAPVINGTGLSKEEVFSVIQRSQKEFARQIGPIFSDWQRRYA